MLTIPGSDFIPWVAIGNQEVGAGVGLLANTLVTALKLPDWLLVVGSNDGYFHGTDDLPSGS